VPIATHVPHAVGFAWGKRLRGEPTCALVFFGDGATSEGAFHEGANFAAVMQAPVILLCNNNHWAISTPLEAQTRAETLADKALGYGMPGVRVDGGDVLAVYEATCEAVARARSGDGPTFIEAVTYRCAPHATADDPSAYIDAERVEAERGNECFLRYERYLQRLGILGDEAAEAVRADALELMRAGIAAAESMPEPDPDLVTRHAYAE
jgi:pyruvate dehydrogenase E1 component subunit alpha